MKKNLTLKGIIVVITAAIMAIPIFLVWTVVDSRESMSRKVQSDIERSWGPRRTVKAPVLAVPYKFKSTDYQGNEQFETAYYELPSAQNNISMTIDSDLLHRSIYDVPVYTAELAYEGQFIPDADFVAKARKWGKCQLELSLNSLKGLGAGAKVSIDGVEHKFAVGDGALRVNLPLSKLQAGVPVRYAFTITVRGSESLTFVPNAGRFIVEVTSDWASPGFNGDYLPASREISKDGFKADWDINDIDNMSGDYVRSQFGIDLVVTASQYQQTERALKYSFLIIILVYMGIFIVEAAAKKPVNIVQYIVTGFSLCLFYLLLLAFSEYILFGWAYLLAALLTCLSLGAYFKAILRSRLGYVFAASVATFYAFIYLLLKLQTGSLLIGSIALFLVLCAIMYFTGNVNKTEE